MGRRWGAAGRRMLRHLTGTSASHRHGSPGYKMRLNDLLDPAEDIARRTANTLLTCEPIGRRVEVEPGPTCWKPPRSRSRLVASCGGIGICGTCRVRIAQGKVTPVTLTEEEDLDAAQLAAGFRLACQADPLSDVRLDIPPDSLTAAQQMQVEGREVRLMLAPAVLAVDLVLEKPNLEDLRSDLARVDEALARLGFGPLQGSLDLLTRLSHRLRSQTGRHAWQSARRTAFRGWYRS